MASQFHRWSVVVLVLYQMCQTGVTGAVVNRISGDVESVSVLVDGKQYKLSFVDEDIGTALKRKIQKRSPTTIVLSTPEGDGVETNTNQEDFLHPVVDFILRMIRSQITKQGKQQITIPDIHKTKFKGVGPVGVTIKFDATEGWFRDLSTIKRVGPIKVSRYGNDIIIEFGVGLRRMEFGYDQYNLKFGLLSTSGHIGGQVNGSSITVKFSMDVAHQSCSLTLLDTKINILGDIKLQVTGMGKLNGLYSRVMTWVANKYREEALPKAESVFHKNIQQVLERLRCEEEDDSLF